MEFRNLSLAGENLQQDVHAWLIESFWTLSKLDKVLALLLIQNITDGMNGMELLIPGW